MRVIEHQWTEHPAGYLYCARCTLLEWVAGDGSTCSGVPGVADEAEGWSLDQPIGSGVRSTGSTAIDELLDRRDQSFLADDLTATLVLDDQLEDAGVHADSRETCHTCQTWADHAHHPLTGALITLEEYRTSHRVAAPWLNGPVTASWSSRPDEDRASGSVTVLPGEWGRR